MSTGAAAAPAAPTPTGLPASAEVEAESAPRPAGGSVARNASLLAVATILARVATFGSAIVMARGLGVASYGRYGFAAALATVIVPFADLGLTPYLGREIARARAGSDALATRLARVKLGLTAGVGLVSALVVLLVLDDGALAAAIVVVLAGLLADSACQFVYGYFRGGERMGFEARTTVIAALARALGAIALVLVFGLLMPVLAWMLAVSASQLAFAGRRFRRTIGHAARERPAAGSVAWKSVGAMGMITLFGMVYLRADSIIAGSILDQRNVGWYTSAYTLVSGLQIVPWMIAVAFTPVFARSHEKDPALFRSSWNAGLRAVLLLSMPCALVTCLLAGPIVALCFGAAFHPATTALAVLVWSTPVWALNMTVSVAIRGTGRESWLAWVTGGGVVLNLGLNFWAISVWGIAGAAAVTVITEGVVFLVLTALGISRGIVPWPSLPYWRMLLALAALAAAALAVSGWPVVLGLTVSLAAYLAVLGLTRVLGREDLATVASVARRGG